VEFRILIRESFKALFKNKLRSALTILGISVGISAVICVVAIGDAAAKQYEEQLSALGDNLIWVEAGGRTINGVRTGANSTRTLVVADAAAILKEVPLIKRVSPQVDGHVQVVYGNHNWSTSYRGESPEYVEIRKWGLSSGANFTEDDVIRSSEVCIIGNTIKQHLYPEEEAVGKVLRVGNFPCKVIGVMSPKGGSVTGQDQDDFVLLPYTTAQKRIAGITWLKDIMCSASSAEAISAANDQIVALLRERHRIRPGDGDDFNMRTPQDVIQAGIEAAKTFSLLLISVASVALLVGGIGIMNVMLVSVTERTREIGIRMAIGATGYQVQTQFLAESVVLSLFGGLCGIVGGSLGSLALGKVLQWSMPISANAVGIAALFASAIGVFFGFYPALKASRLDPIEALRYE